MPTNLEIIRPSDPHAENPDVFDLRNALMAIWDSCLAYWWTIPATITVCCLGIVVYLLSFQPVFRAEVGLLGEADNDSSRQNFYAYWNTFRKNDLVTEAEMLVSPTTIRKVVEDLDLKYEEVYHPPLSRLVYLWGESFVGKNYRRVKRIIFPPAPLPPGVTEEDVERTLIVKDMRAGISINAVKDSVLGYLELKGPTPRVAEVANAIALTYLELRKERLIAEARMAYESLAEEAASTLAELEIKENEQRAFFDKSEMFLRFEKDKVEIAQWIQMKSNLVEIRSDLEGLMKRRESLQAMLGGEEETIIASEVKQINPIFSTLEAQVTSLNTQLEQARLKFTEDAPEVREIIEMIASSERRMGEVEEYRTVSQSTAPNVAYEQLRLSLQNVESEIADLQQKLAVRQADYTDLERQIKEIPFQMMALDRLTRDVLALEKRYALLKERMDLAEVSMATSRTAPAAFSIVDPARMPTKPDWPNKKLLFLGAILIGGFLGLTLSVLLNFFVGKVTENRLKLMRGYPVFAHLRLVGSQTKVRLNKAQVAGLIETRQI